VRSAPDTSVGKNDHQSTIRVSALRVPKLRIQEFKQVTVKPRAETGLANLRILHVPQQ